MMLKSLYWTGIKYPPKGTNLAPYLLCNSYKPVLPSCSSAACEEAHRTCFRAGPVKLRGRGAGSVHDLVEYRAAFGH